MPPLDPPFDCRLPACRNYNESRGAGHRMRHVADRVGPRQGRGLNGSKGLSLCDSSPARACMGRNAWLYRLSNLPASDQGHKPRDRRHSFSSIREQMACPDRHVIQIFAGQFARPCQAGLSHDVFCVPGVMGHRSRKQFALHEPSPRITYSANCNGVPPYSWPAPSKHAQG